MIVGSNPVVVLHRNHFLYVTTLSISQYHFSIFIYFPFVSTKLQVILKSPIKLNKFCLKDPVPQILTSHVVISFSVHYVINPIAENVLGILL